MARKPRITPARAKSLIGLAKVVGPAVIPVVTPYAVRAAGMARDAFDRMRARRLGIDVGDLSKFSGRGGALHARIAGAAAAVADLRAAGDTEFADSSDSTLMKLAAVVRAAERMPTSRRKAAHRAVSTELDHLEVELLRRLGIAQ